MTSIYPALQALAEYTGLNASSAQMTLRVASQKVIDFGEEHWMFIAGGVVAFLLVWSFLGSRAR